MLQAAWYLLYGESWRIEAQSAWYLDYTTSFAISYLLPPASWLFG